MLNVGSAELLVILLVALVVLGPERLPVVARQLGRTVESLRGMARSFQAEFEAATKPGVEPTAEQGTDPFAIAAAARAVNTESSAEQAALVDDGAPADLLADSGNEEE